MVMWRENTNSCLTLDEVDFAKLIGQAIKIWQTFFLSLVETLSASVTAFGIFYALKDNNASSVIACEQSLNRYGSRERCVSERSELVKGLALILTGSLSSPIFASFADTNHENLLAG